MKKFYIVIPVAVGLIFLISFFSPIIAVGCFFLIPFVTLWWLHRNNVSLFIEPSKLRERICLISLSNRELIPFLGRKITDEWVRISDKFLRIGENDEYIFHQKIIMFALQKEDMSDEEIVEMKNKLKPRYLSKKVLFNRTLLKGLMFPVGGTVLLFFPLLAIPGWITLIVGPFYMLYEIRNSGALELAEGQSGNEITVFYIRSSRKLKIIKAETIGQKWHNYKDAIGKVKVTDGSDYFFGKKKVFFSGAKVPITFPLELADKASEFREWGLRGWDELNKAMEIANEKGYDSVEGAYNSLGQDLIRNTREELRQEEKEKKEKMMEVRAVAE